MNKPIEERYISQVNWLVSSGREDLIDEIADEYESHLAQWRLEAASAATEAGADQAA